jgi:tyrosyl-tRNA synthetase
VAVPKVVEDNGVLALVEFVLLPASALSGRREFQVERDRDGLEPLVYTDIKQIHEDYRNDIRKLNDPSFFFLITAKI